MDIAILVEEEKITWKFVLRRAENTELVCRYVISGKSRCFARNKLNRREINVLNTHTHTHTLGLPVPYALLTFIRSKEDRFHHIECSRLKQLREWQEEGTCHDNCFPLIYSQFLSNTELVSYVDHVSLARSIDRREQSFLYFFYFLVDSLDIARFSLRETMIRLSTEAWRRSTIFSNVTWIWFVKVCKHNCVRSSSRENWYIYISFKSTERDIINS